MYYLGIVGHTGMVGQELRRIIEQENNKKLKVAFTMNSRERNGKEEDCDIIFLATKDDISLKVAGQFRAKGLKVIDMSGAFRLEKADYEKWYKQEHNEDKLLKEAVYGLPALFENEIRTANLVANPGCYAESSIIPLYPIRDLVKGEATIVSTSGNSGARQTIEDESNDISYNYGKRHRHVPEIIRYSKVEVNFTPIVLRSVFRGINTNIRVELIDDLKALSDEEARIVLEDTIRGAYKREDLVEVVRDSKDKLYGTRDINDSNQVKIKVNVEEGFAYINSCLDNLGKGAASQGIENMNIMLGLERDYGISPLYRFY